MNQPMPPSKALGWIKRFAVSWMVFSMFISPLQTFGFSSDVQRSPGYTAVYSNDTDTATQEEGPSLEAQPELETDSDDMKTDDEDQTTDDKSSTESEEAADTEADNLANEDKGDENKLTDDWYDEFASDSDNEDVFLTTIIVNRNGFELHEAEISAIIVGHTTFTMWLDDVINPVTQMFMPITPISFALDFLGNVDLAVTSVTFNGSEVDFDQSIHANRNMVSVDGLHPADGFIRAEEATLSIYVTRPEPPVTPVPPVTEPEAPVMPDPPATEPETSVTPEPPVTEPETPTTPEPPATEPEAPVMPEPPVTEPEAPVTPEPPATEPEAPVTPKPPATEPKISVTPEPPMTEPETPTTPEPPTTEPEAPVTPVPPVTEPEAPVTPEPPATEPEAPVTPEPPTTLVPPVLLTPPAETEPAPTEPEASTLAPDVEAETELTEGSSFELLRPTDPGEQVTDSNGLTWSLDDDGNLIVADLPTGFSIELYNDGIIGLYENGVLIGIYVPIETGLQFIPFGDIPLGLMSRATEDTASGISFCAMNAGLVIGLVLLLLFLLLRVRVTLIDVDKLNNDEREPLYDEFTLLRFNKLKLPKTMRDEGYVLGTAWTKRPATPHTHEHLWDPKRRITKHQVLYVVFTSHGNNPVS